MIMSRDEEDCKSPIMRSILENVRFTVLRVLGGAGPGVTSGGGWMPGNRTDVLHRSKTEPQNVSCN